MPPHRPPHSPDEQQDGSVQSPLQGAEPDAPDPDQLVGFVETESAAGHDASPSVEEESLTHVSGCSSCVRGHVSGAAHAPSSEQRTLSCTLN